MKRLWRTLIYNGIPVNRPGWWLFAFGMMVLMGYGGPA